MEDHFRYARTTFKCFGFTSQAAKNKPYLSKPEGGALNNWGGGYWTKHLPCTTKEVKSMLSCFHLGAYLTSRYHAFFTKNKANKQAITTTKRPKKKKNLKALLLGKRKCFGLYYCQHKGKLICDRKLATRRPDKCKFRFTYSMFRKLFKILTRRYRKCEKAKTPILRVLTTQCLFWHN